MTRPGRGGDGAAAIVFRAPRSSGLGSLRLHATGRGLVRLEILQRPGLSQAQAQARPRAQVAGRDQARHVLARAASELRAYLAGRRNRFTCPVDLRGLGGSPFQQRVWRALLEIPFGETRTYGEVARLLGRPRASRAVGMACHCNPVAIIIPCHRVIGRNGRLTGYSAGLAIKDTLLRLEQRQSLPDRIGGVRRGGTVSETGRAARRGSAAPTPRSS